MDEIYHQMTLDEWMASKKRIHEMIRTAKAAFIVIGYELRKIEETEAYRMDGYDSLAEFAKAEYGFEKTMTSRLIDVNRTFSEGGYSDILIEDAQGFTFTKLVEMKDLPPEDLQLVRPDTKRDDIRELKRFEAEEAEIREPAAADERLDEFIIEFFRKEKEALNEIHVLLDEEELISPEEIAEIVSPTGNKAFRKGLYMGFFYKDTIKLKNRDGTIIEWDYLQLLDRIRRIFGEAAAGSATWEAFFEEPGQTDTSGDPGPGAAAAQQEAGSDKTGDGEAAATQTESVARTPESVSKPPEIVSKPPEIVKKPAENAQKQEESAERQEEKTMEEPEGTTDRPQGEKERQEGEQHVSNSDIERAESIPDEASGNRVDPDGGGEDTGSGNQAVHGSETGDGEGGQGEGSTDHEDPLTVENKGFPGTVAPAQLDEKQADENGETDRNKLAEWIDNSLEILSEDIGKGRYHAALREAERLHGHLSRITKLIREDEA